MDQRMNVGKRNDKDFVTWIKSGWKTTEFWLAIGVSFIGLLLLGGLFGSGDGYLSKVNNISGAIMIIGPVVSYILARGKAKQNENSGLDINAILALLANPDIQDMLKKNIIPPKR
jgi:undecaprenyl pyrophosphate phosphatase UppP